MIKKFGEKRNLKVQIRLPALKVRSSLASPSSALVMSSKKSIGNKRVSRDISPADVPAFHRTHHSSSPSKRRDFRTKQMHKRVPSDCIKVIRPLLNPTDLVLGKCIGRGKLGRVLRCDLNGQEFAVKLVEKTVLHYAEAERDALMSLVHSHIVALHNYTEDTEKAYLVLELVPGEDLFHAIRRKRLTRTEVSKIGAQVLLALEYIHRQGFVYRDLKPENIMVLPSGEIKLVDFGFSKRLIEDRTYTTVGSPEYMAPEVILKEGHNKAADWWSYGVLLYEMMCGQPPFRGNSIEETYDEIVSGSLEFSRNIEPSAKDIIRRLLMRDQSSRLGGHSEGPGEIKRHKFFAGFDWSFGTLASQVS